jgi:hypothetical protein
LTLAKSVAVPDTPDAIWPACFPDVNGQVYLRGHVTLAPVPSLGGGLLGMFRRDSKGACACTPLPDLSTQGNDVITTTTALAYPRDTPNKPDVCIVRLLVSLYMPVDVNLDQVVNATDVNLVQASPYYDIILSDLSKCPAAPDGTRMCGRADVNGDGFVNQLDQTSISQSADYMRGVPLPCGGIYATAFSCGSNRAAPLTPAVSISLDSIVYFNNDGEFGSVSPVRKRAAAISDLTERVLVIFDNLQSELHDFQSVVNNRFDTVRSEVDMVRSEVDMVRSEVDTKVAAVDTKFGIKLSTCERRSSRSSQRQTLVGVSFVVGAVVLCGAVIYRLAQRR